MGKKRFFASHSKSSAMIVSIAVHAVIIVVALSFVAVKVIIKEDPTFEAKRVKHPKMPPKKIQVPVNTKKRKPKPRLRQRIVTQKRTFNDIKMPEITGVKGGMGNMGGDGLGSLGFDFKMDLFGGDSSSGNELTGTFFDLKQTKDGKPIQMDTKKFFAVLAHFADGWNIRRLNDYFQSPKKKYATFFMIPIINSASATKAFGVQDTVKPDFWAAYYEGHIAAPETGKYRFHGYGDDILLVRIKKRLVLDAGYAPYRPMLKTGWKSRDDNNRKYPIGGQTLFVGDWFKLNKGESVKMEVLIGDVGGLCSSQLLIEQKGKIYRQVPFTSVVKNSDGKSEKVKGMRPVIPAFKTREIPKDPKLRQKMKLNLNQASLDGPIFGTVK